MLLLRDRELRRRMLALAAPVALQNLITFAVGFADRLMVGTLGDRSIAAVYAAGQVQLLAQFFSGGIETALMILASRSWGKGDLNGVRSYTASALLCSLFFGLLIAVICLFFPAGIISIFNQDAQVVSLGGAYLRIVCPGFLLFCANQCLIAALRSIEAAKIGLAVSAISLGMNVLLNWLLVFGSLGFPRLEIRGAAIATLLSRALELGATLFYLLRIDRRLKLKIRLPDKNCLKEFIRCGAPITGGQLIWSANNLASAAILGSFGPAVTAAAGVANSLNNLAYAAMNGAATAVGVITGKIIGSGSKEKLREYSRSMQFFFLLLGIGTGALVFLLRRPFISLFTGISREAAAHALRFSTVLAIAMIGTCYQQACFTGLVKPGGDVGFVFRMDLLFIFLLVLPAAMIALRGGGAPWLVYACLKCDQILKCPVAAWKLRRGNWVRRLN